MSEPRAWIVIGLGFGDCGKGTLTDYLVRAKGARLVVRYNGGAQAGHNVVTADGRHHTFSQLGSGSFVAGVRSHLASTVVVHPSALRVEAKHLRRAGVGDALERLTIGAGCRVTTPFHQAAGRLRELARGERAHGSCGVGVGETVRDALAHPEDALLASDLKAPRGPLRAKLERIRRRLLRSLSEEARGLESPAADLERGLLGDPSVAETWLSMIEPISSRVPLIDEEEALARALPEPRGDLVLEGAQGILLDEHVGFHPHTTWSTCTSSGAEAWLRGRRLPHAPIRLGVLRTYATRHGAGPLPSEAEELRALLPETHNASAGWQGRFRVGWPDPVLCRYAVAANGGLDALALTHVDRLAALPAWRLVRAYSRELELSRPGDLEEQAALGRYLLRAEPSYEQIEVRKESDFVERLEARLGVPVRFLSRGPTALDKEARGEM